jgi:hypothetical protein
MISNDDLKSYIAETGYRDLSEIKAKFVEEDPEVLSMCLTFLIQRNKIKRIKFIEKTKIENELFYISV